MSYLGSMSRLSSLRGVSGYDRMHAVSGGGRGRSRAEKSEFCDNKLPRLAYFYTTCTQSNFHMKSQLKCQIKEKNQAFSMTH